MKLKVEDFASLNNWEIALDISSINGDDLDKLYDKLRVNTACKPSTLTCSNYICVQGRVVMGFKFVDSIRFENPNVDIFVIGKLIYEGGEWFVTNLRVGSSSAPRYVAR